MGKAVKERKQGVRPKGNISMRGVGDKRTTHVQITEKKS
jgi:hypothetical protein